MTDTERIRQLFDNVEDDLDGTDYINQDITHIRIDAYKIIDILQAEHPKLRVVVRGIGRSTFLGMKWIE